MKVKREDLDQYDYVSGDYLEKVIRKYSSAIGLFIIRFNSFEHELDVHIADKLSDASHHFGYLLIQGLTFNAKTQLFRKLFQMELRMLKPGKLNGLNKLMKRIDSVRVFRNYITHANWCTLKNNGYVRTKIDEKEGDVFFKHIRLTPQTIHTWTERIVKLEWDMEQFCDGANT